MTKQEKCDHCKELGILGPEIRAYKFATPKGRSVVRFLHASDGGRPCYAEFDKRYRTYIDEQRAKVASG